MVPKKSLPGRTQHWTVCCQGPSKQVITDMVPQIISKHGTDLIGGWVLRDSLHVLPRHESVYKFQNVIGCTGKSMSDKGR